MKPNSFIISGITINIISVIIEEAYWVQLSILPELILNLFLVVIVNRKGTIVIVADEIQIVINELDFGQSIIV
jgi:hypothetical protein